ncbi:hypothetical protein BCR44DRAFT_1439246 [Catenaria anguillulae PL171]|uniref:Uncharacterized protein n=1 Tax=Catenaria anguillulae PL171 TaxID=765915 RepID=A0A1Y2HEJ8_9FUNG|nr:hypothetical protein BCR44DRAFT_1439246 [Catenaria anguillulae PL171]
MVDDLLHSADYPDLALLANTYSSQIEHLLSLHLCTAIPVTSDQAAFRLDKSKVTKWLTAKVQSLAAALALKAATPASNVYPPRPSPHIVGDDQWAWTRYAMTLIGEWLVKGSVSEEWMRAVSEALGVPPVQVAGLASANGDHEEAGGPSKKAKAAAAIKVPKGQKSVAAFFAKKS